jgi:hypothetical protein
MEGEQLAESDYGILITSTAKTMELEQAIKQYAQAFIQNGGSMSTIMDIYFSPSLSDMRRKLETAEEEIQRRNSEQAQEANKIQQEANQATQALEQQKLQLEEAKNIRDNETKIYIAELGKEMSNDVDSTDGIDNPLEQSKFELDVQAKRNDYLLKIKALDNDMKKHADNVELKKESNSISRIKKKSTT